MDDGPEGDLLDMLRAVGLIPSTEATADRYVAVAFLMLNCSHTVEDLPEDRRDAFWKNVTQSFMYLGIRPHEMSFVLDEIIPMMVNKDEYRWSPPAETEGD